MRWPSSLLIVVGVAASAAPAGARSSNPAFLGVGMQDAGGARGAGPCLVTEITKDSGADAAGLRSGDMFATLDGKEVASCDALIGLIQARAPGEVVTLEVRRGGLQRLVTVKAQLLSRDEVLRRRFVGRPVPATALVRVDDRSRVDLSAAARRTTIVGWYAANCDGCDRVLATVAHWAETTSARGSAIAVVGATAGSPYKSAAENLDDLKLAARALDVPLLLAERDTYEQFAINDGDRIHFMVIDSRGIVQYVAPVAPKGDDTEAVLDELFAAVQQASRRSSR